MSEDGRIIIDTKINSDGIEIGEKELKKKLSSMAKNLELNIKIKSNEIRVIQEKLSGVRKEIEKSPTAISGLIDKTKVLQKALDKTATSADISKIRLEAIKKTMQEMPSIEEKISPAIKNNNKPLELFKIPDIPYMEDEISNFVGESSKLVRQKLESNSKNLDLKIKVKTEEYEYYKKLLQEVNAILEQNPETYSELSESAKLYEDRINNISSSIKKLSLQKNAIKNSLENLPELEKEINLVKIPDISSEIIKQIEDTDGKIRAKLEKKSKDFELKIQIKYDEIDKLKEKIGKLNEHIKSNPEVYDQVKNQVKDYQSAIDRAYKSLEKYREEQEAVNSVLSRIPKMPKIEEIPNIKNLEWNVSGINTAPINSSLEKIRNGIRTKINNTCEEAKIKVKGLGEALATMLGKFGNMLIYQSLRQMARALIEEVKQGVADLSVFDEQFGQTMQNVKDSFKNMVNSITTFLAPLISTIGKVLKGIFDGITWFFNETTKFFAALRGEKYVIVADTNFKNYGKSVEKAGKATRKAKKDTGDMMKALAKFDKLDVLKKDKKSDLGNAIGGVGSKKAEEINPALDMFKKVDTSEWRKKIAEFNKATREFILKNFKDFDKWGDDIGEKFNNIGETLKKDWQNLWDNFGQNSGTMFSEFFSDVGDTWDIGWEGLKKSFSNFGTNVGKAWDKLKDNCSKTAKELKDDTGDIGTDFKNLLDSIKKGDWEGVKKNFENLGKDTTETFDKLKTNASKTWDEFVDDSKSTLETLGKDLNDTWEKVKTKWNDTTENFKKNWNKTWTEFAENTKTLFSNLAKNIIEFLASVLKGFVRTILQNTAIGRSIEFIVKGDRHNREITEKIERGELTPEQALEETKKFNRQLFNLRRIPGLATGTVVSPGREFLARLGDNTREQEIVSPISTMKQAFSEALREYGGGGGAVLQLDGETFARLINPYSKAENNRLGISMVSEV